MDFVGLLLLVLISVRLISSREGERNKYNLACFLIIQPTYIDSHNVLRSKALTNEEDYLVALGHKSVDPNPPQ